MYHGQRQNTQFKNLPKVHREECFDDDISEDEIFGGGDEQSISSSLTMPDGSIRSIIPGDE